MPENSRWGKYNLLGLLFGIACLGQFDRMAMSFAAVPISREFQFDAKLMGLIMSSFSVSYALMQLVSGWIVNRYGSRLALFSCIMSWSFFTACTGIAWSFVSLVGIRFLFGIGEGPFSAASSLLVAETFSHEMRARAKSLLLSAFGLGNAAGALFVTALIVWLGWRSIFMLLGLIGMVLAVVFHRMLRRNGSEKRRLAQIPFRRLVSLPLAAKLMAVWFGAGIVNWGMISWLPSYWVNAKHISMLSMGAVMVLPTVAQFFSINAGGWLLDNLPAGKERYLVAAGSMGTAVGIYLMFNATEVMPAIAFMTLAMTANGFIGATVFSLPVKYLPQSFIGSVTGVINFGGQCGGMIGPAAMGWLISEFQGAYEPAFWFLIGCVSISLLAGATLAKTDKLSGPTEDGA